MPGLDAEHRDTSPLELAQIARRLRQVEPVSVEVLAAVVDGGADRRNRLIAGAVVIRPARGNQPANPGLGPRLPGGSRLGTENCARIVQPVERTAPASGRCTPDHGRHPVLCTVPQRSPSRAIRTAHARADRPQRTHPAQPSAPCHRKTRSAVISSHRANAPASGTLVGGARSAEDGSHRAEICRRAHIR